MQGILYVLLSFCILVDISLCYLNKEQSPIEYVGDWAVSLANGVDPHSLERYGFEVIGNIATLEQTYLVRHKQTHDLYTQSHRNKLVPSSQITSQLYSIPHVTWAEQQYLVQYHTRGRFDDPLFDDQWHLINKGQFSGTIGIDIHIEDAWNMGYNGAGVRVAVVDDGFQTIHPDLAPHFAPDSSYSFNSPIGDDPNPNITNREFHGTAAAGVAIAANNSMCGVGSAFMASGSGIRLIATPITDATQAQGLLYKNQLNDIYSNSWGPSDSGIVVGGPRSLTKAALKSGTESGRHGLGSIFVWAAGNGALVGDNCNYDGFNAARETIAVGAIGNDGTQAYYSEPCAALLVVAPSSSVNSLARIRTSDIVGIDGYDTSSCTSTFGGTSSACPLVAGVVALMLQANPSLTWRDIPIILAETAIKTDSLDSDWVTNGAQYHVNHKYGFGRIDATAAVKAALVHENIGPQVVSTTGTVRVNQAIPDYPNVGTTAYVTVTDNVTIEKIIVTVTIDHPTSGDLQIEVTSPAGTKSLLSTPHAISPLLKVGDDQYSLGVATFGTKPWLSLVSGKIVPTSPNCVSKNTNNCNALFGAIAFVAPQPQQTCYSDMAKIVQNCNAIALVIQYSPQATNSPGTIPGTDTSVTIPVVSISRDDGTVMNKNGDAAITGTQTPVNNYKAGWDMAISRCLGENANGTWKIQVIDGFPGGTGTFNSFALSIYGTGTVANKDNGLSTGAIVAITIVVLAAVAVVVLAIVYHRQGHIFGYCRNQNLSKKEKLPKIPYIPVVEENVSNITDENL